jgi:hypothetical protein
MVFHFEKATASDLIISCEFRRAAESSRKIFWNSHIFTFFKSRSNSRSRCRSFRDASNGTKGDVSRKRGGDFFLRTAARGKRKTGEVTGRAPG